MSQVQTRELALEDYDAIMNQCLRAGLSSSRPLGRDSVEALEQGFQEGKGSLGDRRVQTFLGLEHESDLIGVACDTHDGRKGWIDRLAVGPDNRRQGHAQRPIAAAERALKALGISAIATLIERHKPDSLALFQEMGHQLEEYSRYLSKRDHPDA